MTVNGNAARPIFIRGLNKNSRPILEKDYSVTGSYTVFENLYFRQRTASGSTVPGFSITGTSDHIVVRHNEFIGQTNYGPTSTTVVSVGGTDVRYTVIYNNEIYNFSDWMISSALDPNLNGLTINIGSHQTWIVDNHVYYMGGDSIRVGTNGAALDAATRF